MLKILRRENKKVVNQHRTTSSTLPNYKTYYKTNYKTYYKTNYKTYYKTDTKKQINLGLCFDISLNFEVFTFLCFLLQKTLKVKHAYN